MKGRKGNRLAVRQVAVHRYMGGGVDDGRDQHQRCRGIENLTPLIVCPANGSSWSVVLLTFTVHIEFIE